MDVQELAIPETATVRTIEVLELAYPLVLQALRQSVEPRRARDAGEIEYDSWAGAIEYESWSAAL